MTLAKEVGLMTAVLPAMGIPEVVETPMIAEPSNALPVMETLENAVALKIGRRKGLLVMEILMIAVLSLTLINDSGWLVNLSK